MQLLLATSNKGKIIEMQESLSELGIEIVLPTDVGIAKQPHEEGNTFEENAREKARFYFERGKLPTLADDSGIIVEALTDELGIHTRRWGAGSDASDHHWIEFFLDRMRREENKRARFICVLCYMDEQRKEHVFEGTCDGVITDELEADYLPGLPISACFKPEGFNQVFSALTLEQKNQMSHRGRALAQLRSFLQRASDVSMSGLTEA